MESSKSVAEKTSSQTVKSSKSKKKNSVVAKVKETAASKPDGTVTVKKGKTTSVVAQAMEVATVYNSNKVEGKKIVPSNVSICSPSNKMVSSTTKSKENATASKSSSVAMPEPIISNGSKTASNSNKNLATTKVKKNVAASKTSKSCSLKKNPEKFISMGSKSATTNDKKISTTAKAKEKPKATAKLKIKEERNKGSTISTEATATNVKKEPKQESTGCIPLVSSSMTIAQLKAECTAREPNIKALSGKNKSWLLSHLSEGSEVQGSNEWKAKKQADRQEEIDKQKVLHCHKYPYVHKCPLAKSSALMSHGTPRRGQCDFCYSNCYMSVSQGVPIYTCESCDWDICQKCFNEKNKSPEEKEQIRKEMRRQAEEERARWKEENARREKENARREEEEKKRWNAKKRFKTSIITPSNNIHLDPDSSTMKYTVWCSDGYDNDGWHSYEGPPEKEFDSVWKSKKEANDRAEYLFFWKNPWGIAPNEVYDDENGDPKPTGIDGLNSWTVSPADSSRWSVGVVPAAAYVHLPNATKRRHYDDGNEPKGYEEHVAKFLFF